MANIIGLDGKPTKYKFISSDFVREEIGYTVTEGLFSVGFTPYKRTIFRKTYLNTQTGKIETKLTRE
jgi:hypothetical protein